MSEEGQKISNELQKHKQIYSYSRHSIAVNTFTVQSFVSAPE
jgi:hypothetical protein